MRKILVLLILLSLATTAFASGEEVLLKNGDKLSGSIVEEGDDAIVVETVYAGRVRIARAHVAKVVKANATTAPKPVAKPAEQTNATAKPGTPAPVIKRSNGTANAFRRVVTGWDGNANLGFSYTSGNSNNITMTTGLRATKARPEDGLTIYFRSLWNSNHGSQITTQNAFWGGVRYDRNLNKKIFGFASYDFERDKPKRLSFRSVAGGGVGHRTVKTDRTELEILVGGAWNRTWQNNIDTDTPEGLVGMTFKHKVNDRLRIRNSSTFYQNVTDRHEYRFILDTSIDIDVTKKIGFFVSVGDRFNNDPFGTAKRNDFLVTTGLKWNFGKKK